MNQVLFSGAGGSEGVNVTITYRPDMNFNIINTEGTNFSIPNEEISKRLQQSNTPQNDVNLFEILQYAAHLAHYRRESGFTPIFQFNPRDPIFGRVAHVKFRFETRQNSSRDIGIINTSFEQTGEGLGSHRLSFTIHMRQDRIRRRNDNLTLREFRFIGVSFERRSWLTAIHGRRNSLTATHDRYDGFYAPEYTNVVNRGRQENNSAPSGGSSSRHDPDPADQNDPPASSLVRWRFARSLEDQNDPPAGSQDQSGSKKSRFHSSDGGAGGADCGGRACPVAPFIRNAAVLVLMVPLGIQAYVQSSMHSAYTNK